MEWVALTEIQIEILKTSLNAYKNFIDAEFWHPEDREDPKFKERISEINKLLEKLD